MRTTYVVLKQRAGTWVVVIVAPRGLCREYVSRAVYDIEGVRIVPLSHLYFFGLSGKTLEIPQPLLPCGGWYERLWWVQQKEESRKLRVQILSVLGGDHA